MRPQSPYDRQVVREAGYVEQSNDRFARGGDGEGTTAFGVTFMGLNQDTQTGGIDETHLGKIDGDVARRRHVSQDRFQHRDGVRIDQTIDQPKPGRFVGCRDREIFN